MTDEQINDLAARYAEDLLRRGSLMELMDVFSLPYTPTRAEAAEVLKRVTEATVTL